MWLCVTRNSSSPPTPPYPLSWLTLTRDPPTPPYPPPPMPSGGSRSQEGRGREGWVGVKYKPRGGWGRVGGWVGETLFVKSRGFAQDRSTRGKIEKLRGFSYWKIEKLPNFHFMFLIGMKFISKLLYILFNQSLSFSDPHLHII